MERTSLVILTPFLDDYDVLVYQGDCIEVMAQLPEASVDAIVTDPPYGLGFMGKDWDTGSRMIGQLATGDEKRGAFAYGGSHDRGYADNDSRAFQAFSEAWAREAFRVLKPGGHLLAFAGTRTYHRMAAGVEDAGFEIRDCIAWMYGSGFPKSLDVSKAIDKAAGAEREVVGSYNVTRDFGDISSGRYGDKTATSQAHSVDVTAPSTPEAEEWNGWGTALKPAYEPIVVARKPLIGTVAANVLEHGTGALNIDACRIGTSKDVPASSSDRMGAHGIYNGGLNALNERSGMDPNAGRWPANVALDETAASMLDQQSGERSAGNFPANNRTGFGGTYRGATEREGITQDRQPTDTGGASRFFYTAKASRQDRNAGGLADNTHPTVKPTELMRWLIRLVTPPGGIILDPFGGSGSTGLAARAENVRCILIEREPEYLNIIRDRLAQLSLFSVPEEDAA
jgi:site-specific DNA-methyltransferase (adenine-specific)